MAPIHVQQLVSRSVSSGATFTITFAVIAVVAILVCIVWALSPYIWRKFFPPKPSQTRYNQPPQPREEFDDDYAERGFYNVSRSRARVRGSSIAMYDPRTQTPFPDRPRNDSSDSTLNMHTSHTFSQHRPAVHQCSGLFTPTQDHRTLSSNLGPGRQKTSKTQPCSDREKPKVLSRDFGDAKDYILTLPEPLCVSRKPVKASLISSMAYPKSLGTKLPSTASEKLLHPNKLFEQIEERENPSSERSSTSLKIESSSEPNQTDSMLRPVCDEEAEKYQPHIKGETSTCAPEDDTRPDTPISSMSDDSESSPHNASITAMHRLKTYRSLVGAPPPVPLQRAGTLTRPKNSVSKIRDIYDRAASESKVQPGISRNDTSSTTKAGTTADSSDRRSASTSATSPPKVAPSKFHASSLSLVPTPLRVMRSDGQPALSPTQSGTSNESKHIGKPILNISGAKAFHGAVVQQGLHRPLQGEISSSTFSLAKSRPTPLTLKSDSYLPVKSKNSSFQVNSQTEGSSGLTNRRAIPSLLASSVYSRNTKGYSIARTNDFQDSLDAQPPFSPSFQSTVRDESEAGTETNLLPKNKAQQVDLAKTKVEDWNFRMVDSIKFDFNIKTSPSSSLKRALSSIGPGESHYLQLNKTRPNSAAASLASMADQKRYRQSTISTEMAPSELALSTVDMPTLRISGFSNQFNTSHENINTDDEYDQGECVIIPNRFPRLRNSWSDPSLVTTSMRAGQNQDKLSRSHRRHFDDTKWI